MVNYPKDWDMTELGTKCEVTSSKRVFESEWKTSGIPFLRTRDIASFHAGMEQKDKLFISESTYYEKVKVSGEPHIGDLLVTGVGTIGLPYLVNKVPMYFKDGNILWVKNSESFEPQFLYLLFLSNEIKQQIIDGSGFTTVGTFTIKNAKKLRLPCPDKNEQKAIADTLSRIDTHIANLTELIEKKKAIRDGALEDLVSGRMRLKGFSDEWEEHSFNDFLKIKRGASPRPIEYYVTQNANGVNWIKIGDAPKYGKHIVATKEKITESGAMQSVRVYPGDFLLSNSMSFGRPYILSIEGCIHDGWLRLFDFQDTADDEYLYYLLSSDSVQRQYQSYAAGSGVQNLNKEVVKKVVVHLPSLPEQKAIAETLSFIDTEIASLEEEKDKMLQIKAGAMDDLLTGRVRLMRQGG